MEPDKKSCVSVTTDWTRWGKVGDEVTAVVVNVDRTLALPKAEQPSDFFWLTDDAEPTRNHPRQHALDLVDATRTDKPAEFKTAS